MVKMASVVYGILAAINIILSGVVLGIGGSGVKEKKGVIWGLYVVAVLLTLVSIYTFHAGSDMATIGLIILNCTLFGVVFASNSMYGNWDTASSALKYGAFLGEFGLMIIMLIMCGVRNRV